MLLTRTLLLKNEPAGTLHSLDELFALANAMEREAAERYEGLAADMRAQNRTDLATVFDGLAAAERGHVDSVTRWSQSRLGHAPDPALVRWEAPETFDAETAAEITQSRLTTPYQALAMAVRNEERAFAFWSYVAAFTDNAEIKKAAETMAREELGHVATLRKERRRAYHREHDAAAGTQARGFGGDRADAGAFERQLAGHLETLEARVEGAARRRASELAEQTRRMAGEAAVLDDVPAVPDGADAETLAEALVEFYLDGAERSTDPDSLTLFQSLAERAIARLAWLRSLAKARPSASG